MNMTKRATAPAVGSPGRIALDLLWFAAASIAAGLMTALAAAAVVMLLAQPAHALEGAYPRAEKIARQDVAHRFVLPRGAREPLRAAACSQLRSLAGH